MNFPEEARFRWLPLLLEAYALIDEGVSVSVGEQRDMRGAEPACREGCDNCCRNLNDIPVYPLELVGIWWYSTEKVSGPVRETLKGRLSAHKSGEPCPFLIDNSCAVYPLRPVSCRQFTVFGSRCAEGEDPYYARRGDVLIPDEDYTNRAFFAMLPFYGIDGEDERMQAVEDGLIHTQVRTLQRCNWSDLAIKMEEFDSRPSL